MMSSQGSDDDDEINYDFDTSLMDAIGNSNVRKYDAYINSKDMDNDENLMSVISKLEKELTVSAQAGLHLLNENKSLRKQMNQSTQMYNKLLEDFSSERQRYLSAKNKVIDEYEEKLFELQSQMDKNNNLTTNMIMSSDPYESLLDKYDQLSITVCELKNDLKNYENIFEMNSTANISLQDTNQYLQQNSDSYNLPSPSNKNKSCDLIEMKLLQEEVILFQNKYQSEIISLQQNIKTITSQNQKLMEQNKESLNELERESEVCTRAIDACKKLSIQLVDSNNEILILREKIHTQIARNRFNK